MTSVVPCRIETSPRWASWTQNITGPATSPRLSGIWTGRSAAVATELPSAAIGTAIAAPALARNMFRRDQSFIGLSSQHWRPAVPACYRLFAAVRCPDGGYRLDVRFGKSAGPELADQPLSAPPYPPVGEGP